MAAKWELNVMSGKNPVHTGQFLNSYDPREFTQEEVVAREGAQNSMDAGRKSKGVTELEFHSLQIFGDAKREFLKMFDFEELLRERNAALKLNSRNSFFASNIDCFLDDDSIEALLIRDKNTCGLGGAYDEYNKSDHFARLVCATNLDDKADSDPNSGGSFGLGKTVYAKSSLINTVIYHSTFEPTKSSRGVNRRLMVSGIYPKHRYNDVTYVGFAYHGVEESPGSNTVAPFSNEAAAEKWEKISDLFKTDAKRNDDEHGTDILILMSNVDLQMIKKAVEDYYFPAVINGSVNIKFVDKDGSVSFPRPLDREDLDQFVRLMKDAQRAKDEKSDNREIASFQKFKGNSLGRFAYELAETDEAASVKNNCVAIMRGTGMIINYVKVGSEQYEPAVGAFVADEEIWAYLVAAENPAHSEWSETARRLQQDFPEIGKELIASLNNRLSSRFSQFQRSLQPDVSSSRSETGMLARLLSSALSGSKGEAPVPPGLPNPVALSLTQQNRDDRKSKWRLVISSNENTPSDQFKLKIIPTISLAGDARMIPIKHMDFTISDANGRILKKGTKLEIDESWSRGDSKEYTIHFDDPGSRNFVVQCKCVANLVG